MKKKIAATVFICLMFTLQIYAKDKTNQTEYHIAANPKVVLFHNPCYN